MSFEEYNIQNIIVNLMWCFYDYSVITVGFTMTSFTVREGQPVTVCAEITGGRIARAVSVNIDSLPTGGTATCTYVNFP